MLGASLRDSLYTKEGCQPTKSPNVPEGEIRMAKKGSEYYRRQATKNDSLKRLLLVIDGKLPRRRYPQRALVFTDLKTTLQLSLTKE